MKKLAIVLLMLLCVACVFTACDLIPTLTTYTITSEKETYTVTVGDTVDYKTYFTITGSDGSTVAVTDAMISAPDADLTKEGMFVVTCTYQNVTTSIVISVKAGSSTGGDSTGGSTGGDSVGTHETIDLTSADNKVSASADKLAFAKGNLKVIIDKAAASSDLIDKTAEGYAARVYKGATVTVEYPKMTKIVINCDDHESGGSTYYSGFDDMTVNGATITREGTVVTITFESTTDKFVSASVASQVRILSIEVFTTTGGSTGGDTTGGDSTGGDSTGGSTGGDTTGGDSTGGDSTGSETQKDIVVTFQDSTGSTTLNSTGDVAFTASSIANGWDSSGKDRGIFFNKTNGNVTLTSTTTVNNVASVTVVVSENKSKSSTIKVKVGGTVFTCDGKDGATFVSVENSAFTFSTTTAVSGTVTIEIVPSVSSGNGIGSTYIQSITLSATGAGSTPTETMPSQSYDASNHEDYDDILFDAIKNYNKQEYGEAVSDGLSSQGKYNVLVIPVEFSDDKFDAKELIDLESVFNNKANTGWESVSSYYNASSYGKLTMTFDITDKITLPNNYSYYEDQQSDGGNIVSLALDMLDARGFDFSNYDYDNDGYIDGVYVIYSAPIDYGDGDYYWAYVYGIESDTKYDGLYAYRYLFASVDFMYESIETSEEDNYNSPIAGLKLNASTYIHETGHMLGLDDYYDYNEDMGSNQGLGGADMMDYTVGDHNPYSKLMLGWVKPTVITSTTTITISSFESSGEFIMVLLDYNGTYFSEYLLIDLYTATGLNALHAGVDNSLLYYDSDSRIGANFGARIYHVDSTIDNPYNENTYGSFTDNNNSVSKDPLIKLVEADGDENFESDLYDGTAYASAEDLWQTGDVFSEIQPNYTRHDGKLVNFDISFDSVTATGATITITFNTAE